MSRILVTGARGFVGAGLLSVLAEQGDSVIAVSRQAPPERLAPLASWHRADLDRLEPLPAAAWRGAEAVVHLAGIAHSDLPDTPENRQRLTRANVELPVALARQAAAEGVGRFLFVSSATVHGTASRGAPFTEESPPAPQTRYASSKATAETSLRALAAREGLALTVLRPPLVYGPGVKGNLARLMGWAAAGRPLPSAVRSNRRDLIGLTNLCRFIAAALARPEAAGETFLISDGEPISTGTLYGELCAAMGRQARFLTLPPGALALLLGVTGRTAVLERLCGDFRIDNAKAVRLLGQQATTPREVELGRMVARWRAEQGTLSS
ncbi:MAG: NAD-dependent epimerase/dehydratase family protein [Kiloniellales bacterium]